MEEDLITESFLIVFCLALGGMLIFSDFPYEMLDNLYSYVYGR